jgi:alanyl-tRNA synthetase
MERVKQMARLEFLCGERATRRARADADLLATLASAYSATPEELPALLEAQRAELKAGSAARRELEESLAAVRARELHAASQPDAAGRRIVVVREAHGPLERLRALGQAYSTLAKGLFIGVVESPPGILVAASPDSELDAGKVLKSALEEHGGRGGGNARVAQGTVRDPAALDAVIAAVLAS